VVVGLYMVSFHGGPKPPAPPLLVEGVNTLPFKTQETLIQTLQTMRYGERAREHMCTSSCWPRSEGTSSSRGDLHPAWREVTTQDYLVEVPGQFLISGVRRGETATADVGT